MDLIEVPAIFASARWFSRALVMKENLRNVQSASLLLTNSFYSAESVYRAYGKRAAVSYLGVDIEKFRPMNLERQNFALGRCNIFAQGI